MLTVPLAKGCVPGVSDILITVPSKQYLGWKQVFETSVMHSTSMWCDHLNKIGVNLP